MATYTWTAPPGRVTDLMAGINVGGNLPDNTTYYYKVIAVNTYAMHWVNCTFSGSSNEATATTGGAGSGINTIDLTWTKTANALGYIILRTQTSGDYSAYGTKFSGASGHYYTTVGDVDTWTDDGSATPVYYSPSLSACKSTSKFPLGCDPQKYGIGRLQISGDVGGNPITPKDIYDDAVANGYDDWVKWDGQNFAIMATLQFLDTEVHFQAKKGTFAIVGGYVWLDSAHTDSNIQFGEMSNGETVNGVNITSIGNYYRPFYIRNNVRIYGGSITGVTTTGVWASDYYVTFTNYFQTWEDCSLVNVNIENYNRWQHISPTAPIKNVHVINGGFDVMNHGKYYMSDIYLNRYLRLDYYDCPRMDRFTSLVTSGYNLYVRDVSVTPNHANLIDFKHPNLCDPVDGLPIIYFLGTLPIDSDVDLYYSLQMLITDKEGNPINNVKVDIRDKNGDIATDILGEDLQLTTDSDGKLWIEKINITGVTNNSITDSSKSWSDKEWVGRNVCIEETGALMKVLTNDSDTLTFTEDFIVNPSTSTNAGIRIEVKRVNMKHKVGSGVGTGDSHTTKTWYTPHEITISGDGYETRKKIVNFKEAQNIPIKLYRSPYKTRIGRE